MKRYYTLAVREDGVWSPQFGDYSRATVHEEMADMLDHDVRRKDLKVIETDDTQVSIMAAIERLNK